MHQQKIGILIGKVDDRANWRKVLLTDFTVDEAGNYSGMFGSERMEVRKGNYLGTIHYAPTTTGTPAPNGTPANG